MFIKLKQIRAKSGKRYRYFYLAENYSLQGKHKRREIYLGKRPFLSRARALELGLEEEELQKIKGLKIIEAARPSSDRDSHRRFRVRRHTLGSHQPGEIVTESEAAGWPNFEALLRAGYLEEVGEGS